MKVLSGIYRRRRRHDPRQGRGGGDQHPARRAGHGDQHHPPGAEPDGPPHGRPEHLHRARAARKGVGFWLDEKALNRNATALFEELHIHLDPRARVSGLAVAQQQMVEIAKALSFRSDVLIMDEPTAALTDTEIDELFRIIRHLREGGAGIVHISHRLEELKQISDRVTVMRDGRYIDTVNTAEVGDPGDHQHDGRPDDLRGGAGAAGGAQRGGRARGPQPQPRPGHPRRQLPAPPGRDPGRRGPRRRGPDRGHAGGVRGGPARLRRDPGPRRGRRDQVARRRRPPRDRLPVRGPQALRPGPADGRRGEHRHGEPGEVHRQARPDPVQGHARQGPRARRGPRDQDARASASGSRTCPAATSRRSSSPSG